MLINEIIIGLGDIAMSTERRSLLILFLALIAVASTGIAIPSRSSGLLELCSRIQLQFDKPARFVYQDLQRHHIKP